jgi:hypothetical protein
MEKIFFALMLGATVMMGSANAVELKPDRATVAKQVAEKCRKDYPDPDYLTQLGCRQMHMEAYDKLQQQDRENFFSEIFDRPSKPPPE